MFTVQNTKAFVIKNGNDFVKNVNVTTDLLGHTKNEIIAGNYSWDLKNALMFPTVKEASEFIKEKLEPIVKDYEDEADKEFSVMPISIDYLVEQETPVVWENDAILARKEKEQANKEEDARKKDDEEKKY